MKKPIITSSGLEIYKIRTSYNPALIVFNNKLLMIDSGTGKKAELEKIQNFIIKSNWKPELLLLTHTHADHAGGAAFLQKEFGFRVVVWECEKKNLLAGMAPPPSYKTFVPLKADLVLNTELYLPEFKAQIRHTPGHTCGSVIIIIDNEVVFLGDTKLPDKLKPGCFKHLFSAHG